MPFIEAFWMTMAREWHGIDILRCDVSSGLFQGFMRKERLTDRQHGQVSVSSTAVLFGLASISQVKAVGGKCYQDILDDFVIAGAQVRYRRPLDHDGPAASY
jgi:hypothetical protein